MTRIAYMSGIKANPSEYAQRAALVVPSRYIPFTRLSRGEAALAILGERMRLSSNYYPEDRVIKKALDMVDNALYGGIAGGVQFIGAIPDELQDVARAIAKASQQTYPASGYFIPRAEKGVRIGDPIVPVKYGAVDCKELVYEASKAKYNAELATMPTWKRVLMPKWPPKTADKAYHKLLFNFPYKKVREAYQQLYLDCSYGQAVENILNAGLEKASLHMMYHAVASDFEPIVGTLVQTKRLLHRAAVNDLGNTAKVDAYIMRSWVELGQVRTALTTGQFTPQNAHSVVMTAMLSPNPDEWTAKMIAEVKKRGGASAIGEPVTVAAITALIVAIGAALASAAKLQAEFNAKKIQTLQNSQGFGSDAFSPEKSDYLKAKGDTPLQVPSDNNNLLLVAGGLAALYFFSK